MFTLDANYIIAALTALIVFFTWRTSRWAKKQSIEMNPLITEINVEDLKTGELYVTIVNNKPHRIVVRQIFYQKKNRVGFYSFKHKAVWEYPKVKERDASGNLKIITQTHINDEIFYSIKIPNFDLRSTYKICVETSGGRCQGIYRPESEPSNK